MINFLKKISSPAVFGLLSTFFWLLAWIEFRYLKVPMEDWLFSLGSAIVFAIYSLSSNEE